MPPSSPIFYCIMSHAHVSLWSEVPVFVSFVLWSGHILLCFRVCVSYPDEWENAGLRAGRQSLWKRQSWVGLCAWELFLLLGQLDVGAHMPLGEGSTCSWPLGTISPLQRLYIQGKLAVRLTGGEVWGVDAVFCISLLTDSRLPLISPNLNDKVVQSLC